MLQSRGNILRGLGLRLQELRKELNLSRRKMAARLGVSAIAYYRNESDTTMPGMVSLHRLHEDFGVSMDWLLFNHGEKFLKEQKPAGEEKARGYSQAGPEIEQLLECMEQDPLLRHEILTHFYKYKNQKETGE